MAAPAMAAPATAAVRFHRPDASSSIGSRGLRSGGAGSWSGTAALPPDGQRFKRLHFVRHAEGHHNVDQTMVRAPAGRDAQLTEGGRRQCSALAKAVGASSSPDFHPALFVSSPLIRTLETAALCFGSHLVGDGAMPLLALEAMRETVNFFCDVRNPMHRNVAQMAAAGVNVDTATASVADDDEIWNELVERFGPPEDFIEHRESSDLAALAARARAAFAWLGARPERDIVIVSHSSFLWHTFNMGRLAGRGLAGPPAAVCDFGGDPELEAWLAERFANAEMKSVVAEFL